MGISSVSFHPNERPMSAERPLSIGKLAGTLALFVVIGVPVFAYLWETLNQLLTGHFAPGRIATSVPIALLLAGLLVMLARVLGRVEKVRVERAADSVKEPS